MIRFPCPCKGHTFDLPDDEAGGLVQCPRCGRLNDVPTLAELSAMDADGTLKLGPPPKPNPRLSFRDVAAAFGPDKSDEQGLPIDLRPSVDDLRSVGAPSDAYDIAPSPGAKSPVLKPRYDPLTGELIRPLDVAPPKPSSASRPGPGVPPRSVPDAGDAPGVPAPARGQAGRTFDPESADLLPPPSVASLPLRLLEPINLTVQVFVAVILLTLSLFSAPVWAGMFFAAPVPLAGLILLLSHYANCLEDLGPGHRDELPPPLRSAEFVADLWQPFVRFVVAMFVAFAPAAALVLHTDGPVRFIGGGVAFVAGVLLFPALLLITCVSQHLGNLSPARVLGTIGVLGVGYVAIVAVTLLALFSHLVAAVCIVEAVVHLFGSARLSIKVALGVAGAATFLSVYLGHLAAWHLALLYRQREGTFPWIFDQLERQRQEHKRLKVLSQLEKTRAQAAKARSV